MKKSPVTTILMVILSLSVLATAVLSCWYVQSIRQMRRLQGMVGVATNNRNLIQSLANEAVEYGKKNPPMEALLQSLSQKQQPSTATNVPKTAPIP